MAETRVESEIPGTVLSIEVQPGEKIGEDEPIMIVESMKMEIPIPSPADGTIKEILVGEEDTITEGQIVAVLET